MTTIVDADAHYLENVGDVTEYLDDDDVWKERFQSTDTNSLFPRSTGDQRVAGRVSRPELPYPERELTPEDIPHMMDQVGADKIVLLSQRALSFDRIKAEDDRPVKFANAYIDYMLDRIVDPDAGIYTAIVAPFQRPRAAAELIDRVGGERGVVGVLMITAGPEPPLGHYRYNPMYEAAQDAGLPMIFHAGGPSLDHFYVRGYERLIETHTLAFPWNNMAQLTSLLVQGVPVKYPDIDFVFQESGIYWVPMMMQRLDAEYMKRQSEAPMLEKPPSKYMKEFYFGTQPLEQPENEEELGQIVDMIGGPERLMYASDYPHWDYDPPSVIENRSFLSDSEKAQILGGNAEEVFGI